MLSTSLGSVFSISGIQKLEATKLKLEELQKKQFAEKESSDYSNQMLQNVIQIIERLITNNSISYWKKEANREALGNLLEIVDNSKGTYVPEVFNQQSRELAMILLEASKSLQLGTDLNGPAALALETFVGKPDNLLLAIQQNLEHKLYFYDLLLTNDEEARQRKSVQDGNMQVYSRLIERAKDIEVCRSEAFRVEYREECAHMRESLATLQHYNALANARTFVNAEKPYRFQSDEVASKGNRSTCVRYMLSDERRLAEQMVLAGVEPILDLHIFYREIFSKDAASTLGAKFLNLVDELRQFLVKYESGEHLKQGGFFTGLVKSVRGVNPEKLACVQSLGAKISVCVNEDKGYFDKSFDIFQCLLDAISQNERICQMQKISLGELSKLFNRFAQKFFLLAFKDVNEVNDRELYDSIVRNIKRMGISEEKYQEMVNKNVERPGAFLTN